MKCYRLLNLWSVYILIYFSCFFLTSTNVNLANIICSAFYSRIGCYVTVFQAICNLRDTFYKEITKVNQNTA